ncbi:hypothetical protein C8F04DRAFT_1180861 [Mycena alexandri]|uniref:Uncharacterized protein n=1 Tax=Mycena alexandri TaxID=1745969 RepID=A0AAD6X6W0_9AGAR|nr:hypothetical protein C8F04DRAFT_1180861 [Mycena alexandri]
MHRNRLPGRGIRAAEIDGKDWWLGVYGRRGICSGEEEMSIHAIQRVEAASGHHTHASEPFHHRPASCKQEASSLMHRKGVWLQTADDRRPASACGGVRRRRHWPPSYTRCPAAPGAIEQLIVQSTKLGSNNNKSEAIPRFVVARRTQTNAPRRPSSRNVLRWNWCALEWDVAPRPSLFTGPPCDDGGDDQLQNPETWLSERGLCRLNARSWREDIVQVHATNVLFEQTTSATELYGFSTHQRRSVRLLTGKGTSVLCHFATGTRLVKSPHLRIESHAIKTVATSVSVSRNDSVTILFRLANQASGVKPAGVIFNHNRAEIAQKIFDCELVILQAGRIWWHEHLEQVEQSRVFRSGAVMPRSSGLVAHSK